MNVIYNSASESLTAFLVLRPVPQPISSNSLTSPTITPCIGRFCLIGQFASVTKELFAHFDGIWILIVQLSHCRLLILLILNATLRFRWLESPACKERVEAFCADALHGTAASVFIECVN